MVKGFSHLIINSRCDTDNSHCTWITKVLMIYFIFNNGLIMSNLWYISLIYEFYLVGIWLSIDKEWGEVWSGRQRFAS